MPSAGNELRPVAFRQQQPSPLQTPRLGRLANNPSTLNLSETIIIPTSRRLLTTTSTIQGHNDNAETPIQRSEEEIVENLSLASLWDQGAHENNENIDLAEYRKFNRKKRWDYQFCRRTYDDYYFALDSGKVSSSLLTSSRVSCLAVKVLTKCKYDTHILSQKIRQLESLWGALGSSSSSGVFALKSPPFTEALSFKLLVANAKAGNVGRCLALLDLRARRKYPPRPSEYHLPVTALEAAGLAWRKFRNPYHQHTDERNILFQDVNHGQDENDNEWAPPPIDNPMRWLDSILHHMHARNVPLDIYMANRMLNTFASTGRSARAQHFWYKVKAQRKRNDQEAETETETETEAEGSNDSTSNEQDKRIRVQWNHGPPSHKQPSQSQRKHQEEEQEQQQPLLIATDDNGENSLLGISQNYHKETNTYDSQIVQAAIAFCDSLTWGACGHDPLKLTLPMYNVLIKVACYRGQFQQALEILHTVIPQQGLEPDLISYNTLLKALAWIGDVQTMEILLDEMRAQHYRQRQRFAPFDQITVGAVMMGYINCNQFASASTFCQDVFNQYTILPKPYTIHLQLLELALASNQVHEAKRHFYFIQQVMMWKPSPLSSRHGHDRIVLLTQENPRLSRRALQQLFSYFGHELRDDEFLV